jgi:hypothetical protein
MSTGLLAGPAAAASITASPSTVSPTGTVFLSGYAFLPQDTITVRIVGPSGGTSTLTFVADGAGQFGGPISPSQGSVAPGVYTVTATGTKTAFVATTTFTVVAAAAPAPAPAPAAAPPAAPAPVAAPVAAPPAAPLPVALPRTGGGSLGYVEPIVDE